MTNCEALSERMPEVARGGEWTAEQAHHLAACPGCTDEWRLVAAAAGIGSRVTIDAARVAGRLRTRLAAAPRPAPAISMFSRRPARWLAGLAAAALLLLVARAIVDRPLTSTTRPGELAVLSELDSLGAPELEAVLEDWTGAAWRPSASVSGLGDLTAEELEKVLGGWES